MRKICLFIVLLAVLLAGIMPALAQETTPEVTETEVAETETAAQTTTEAAQPNGLVTALRHTHSLVRWIVVIVALATLVKLGLGLAQNTPFDDLSRRLMLAFSVSITAQWVIGLAFLIVYGGIVGFGLRHFWEHAVTMTIAVALSHMHNRFKNAESSIRTRNSLIIVVVVLVLVFVGVALLPQGWRIVPV